jgi:undecaprenyl-diphosphatase
MNELLGYFLICVYGVIQGLTEVLPISSSGHLSIAAIVPAFPPINLTVIFILHSGSLVAITWWFRKDLHLLWHQFSRSLVVLRSGTGSFDSLSSYQKVPYLMGLSLLVTLVIALALKGLAEAVLVERYWTSIFLFLNGLILSATAWRSRGALTVDELTWKDYLYIGIMQGVAIIPGISRLGMVLCASLLRRLGWYESLRLSFLLSIPTVAGGLLLQLLNIANLPFRTFSITELLLGAIVALIASLAGLYFLSGTLLEKRSLTTLGYYCCMMGAFSFLYLVFGY